jgi:hypothetical protein
MEWKGQSAWQNSPEVEWKVLGKHAGSIKAAGDLTFLKVAAAGHMVGPPKVTSSPECISLTHIAIYHYPQVLHEITHLMYSPLHRFLWISLTMLWP